MSKIEIIDEEHDEKESSKLSEHSKNVCGVMLYLNLNGTDATKKAQMIACLPQLRQPYPWLISFNKDEEENYLQTFYNILEGQHEIRMIPEFHNKYISRCNKEWLVLLDMDTHDRSLFNMLTMENVQLPHLDFCCERHHSLFFPEKDGRLRVFFFQGQHSKARSCLLGDTEFAKYDVVIDNNEHGPHDNLLTTAYYSGELYAFTMFNHLVVAEISDPSFYDNSSISFETLINCSIINDLLSKSGDLRYYLVESSTDILLIFINYWGVKVVDLKIFKADMKELEWVRVDRLGDAAIFLDNSSGYSYLASANGLKGNSIYLVNGLTSNLYVYDLEDQSFYLSVLCLSTNSDLGMFWMSVPSEREKAMVKKETLDEGHDEKEIPNWSDLPKHLLCEIFSRLLPQDRVVFKSVNKCWDSMGTTLAKKLELSLDLERCYPYLLFSNNRVFHPISEKCHVMDSPNVTGLTVLSGPSYGKFHNLNFVDMPNALVRMAKDDWLLMSEGFSKIFFFNPLTKQKVQLPDCEGFLMSMYFSSPPTSSNWFVIVAARTDSHVVIHTIKSGEEQWSSCEFLLGEEYFGSYINPVVFKGLYYFPTGDGRLLIHNTGTGKFYFRDAPEFAKAVKSSWEQYMVVSDGQLLGVFVGVDGSWVYVCQWNLSAEKWEMVESLGDDKVLFLSHTQSLCTRATISGTGNRIYFPRLIGSHCLFYSLTTKKLHTSTFLMEASFENFDGSKDYLGSIWMLL